MAKCAYEGCGQERLHTNHIWYRWCDKSLANHAFVGDLPIPVKPQSSLGKAATALLDAMETCHICKVCLMLPQSPVHCEDCSSYCESHEQPECTTIYELCKRLREALAK